MTILTPIFYDQLGSSNDEARSLARSGAASGTLVVAKTQTQGRGRQGREWHSPVGNFYGSLIWRSPKPPSEIAPVALVAAIALYDSVANYLALHNQQNLTLKWPNDLHFDGQKLAGILVESEISPKGEVTAIIIGIGVNITAAPNLADYPTTCIHSISGVTPLQSDFIPRIGNYLIQRLSQWEQQGFAPLSDEWNRRAAAYLGRTMTAKPPNQALGGIFRGVAANGALLLESHGKISSHQSGEWQFSD